MPIEIVFNSKQNYGALKNGSFNDTFIGSFVVKKDNYYTLGNIDLSSDNYFSNCSNGDTLTLFITNKNIEETSILEISIDYVEPPTLVTFGNIFPNPVDGNGKINVQISGLSIGSPIEIALFNLLGQKITKQQVAHSNQNIQIDLNNLSKPLSSGIYFLNIKTDEGEKTKKFTIVK